VIAGSRDAIDEAIALVKTDADFKGGKALPLAVSAPFHCALMAPARDRMAGLFTKAGRPSALMAPYVPNRTARLTSEPGVVFELLIEQVDRPVLWRQTIESVLSSGITQGVEFGPGKVLQGLAKRITSPTGQNLQTAGMSDLEGLRALPSFLRSSS
jgi:[acyl-carrier-protein] S-malonyltransferase